MEAESEDAVNQRLRAQQLQPTRVKKKPKAFTLQIGTGVGQKDVVTFTRLFATMIDAGLPIVQCLDILQGQTDNKFFANILRDVKASVEDGIVTLTGTVQDRDDKALAADTVENSTDTTRLLWERYNRGRRLARCR